MRSGRWEPCVAHRGIEISEFVGDHFDKVGANVLLVAGAGFDPRSTAVAKMLGATRAQVTGVFLREERPRPADALRARADQNAATLADAVDCNQFSTVNIFGSDGAVIGGRNAVMIVGACEMEGVTDVVIDTSALSIGTAFPIVRYLVELSLSLDGGFNLHLMVNHNPTLDAGIRGISSDVPSFVHGFRGPTTLDSSSRAAKLWLPQLASGRRAALDRLHTFVDPHDTCPILPFPALNPRAGDELANEFLTELSSGWSVDTRNMLYADESDPLDLYRTILRLDDLRKPVFEGVGGSLVILSPLGSKLMALGALMAALERDLPVAYLESIGYEFDEASELEGMAEMTHIWLEGEVYPQPRPKLTRGDEEA